MGDDISINYSSLTPAQRAKLEEIKQVVAQSTINLGSEKSTKAVNEAVQKYFKELKAKGSTTNREEPFQPNPKIVAQATVKTSKRPPNSIMIQ